MKIYDISQEVFSSCVYPGDPEPSKNTLCSIEKGDLYNLNSFSMCAHNGTHIDAPSHFIKDGKTISEMDLEKMTGYCFVAEFCGDVTKEDAKSILNKASERAKKRILIKGNATVTKEAALVFADEKICLIGNESQSVGPLDAPMEVHKILLSDEIVLLEGIRLSEVPCGEYFLSAAPINLGALEGAPCRALLIKEE